MILPIFTYGDNMVMGDHEGKNGGWWDNERQELVEPAYRPWYGVSGLPVVDFHQRLGRERAKIVTRVFLLVVQSMETTAECSTDGVYLQTKCRGDVNEISCSLNQ